MSQPTQPKRAIDSAAHAVVVAVDGSDHARRAVEWAADQAALEHRRLIAVSIGNATGTTAATDAAATARERQPDLSVQGLDVPGDPRQVLIDLSAHTYLLVVGSRGRGALRSMMLGSVSAAISGHAACPVVVCRPPVAGETQNGIVVGADATTESLPAIEFAYRQAALHRLPITVLHCYWDAAAALAQYRESLGQKADAPELEDLRAFLSESVAGLAEQYPDVPVTLSLKHGLVDEALSPRRNGWGMVVVGRHPMTSLARVLKSSISTAVVERANTTVAVVPATTPPS